MILHTVNKSSTGNKLFIQCLDNLQEGDCIILLGDAINIARKENNYLSKVITQLNINVKFYGLQEEGKIKNHKEDFCRELKLVDYDGFLDLAIQCSVSQSWY